MPQQVEKETETGYVEQPPIHPLDLMAPGYGDYLKAGGTCQLPHPGWIAL